MNPTSFLLTIIFLNQLLNVVTALVEKETNKNHPVPAETFLECIDNWEDFEMNLWTSSISVNLQYAETEVDLPGVFQNNLLADGILYYHGDGSKQQMMYKMGPNVPNVQPTFMYVRYYGAVADQQIFLLPSTPDDYQFLSSTSNFEWGEAFVMANGTSMQLFGLNVGTTSIANGEYLFVDKIIVAQGFEVNGIEEIKNLCQWNENPSSSSTTTTTISTETTTLASGKCETGGFIPHPTDCSSFHVCLYSAFGLYGDLIFTCPAPQVWCQSELRCEIPQICPCPE